MTSSSDSFGFGSEDGLGMFAEQRFAQVRRSRLFAETNRGPDVAAAKLVAADHVAALEIVLLERLGQRIDAAEADIERSEIAVPFSQRFGAKCFSQEVDDGLLMRPGSAQA